MDNQILRLPEVMRITGLGRSTIYLKVKQNAFPQQFHLSERAVGWLAHEINKWVKERIVAARGEQI